MVRFGLCEKIVGFAFAGCFGCIKNLGDKVVPLNSECGFKFQASYLHNLGFQTYSTNDSNSYQNYHHFQSDSKVIKVYFRLTGLVDCMNFSCCLLCYLLSFKGLLAGFSCLTKGCLSIVGECCRGCYLS